MSQRNVELVRADFEAFGRGDFDLRLRRRSTRSPLRCTAEDGPDSSRSPGLDELRAFVAHLADPWTDRFGPAIHFEDFIDCGDWVV